MFDAKQYAFDGQDGPASLLNLVEVVRTYAVHYGDGIKCLHQDPQDRDPYH